MTMNISPKSRMSTFSDKNLTTLESLVLEVALEDAHQQTRPNGVSGGPSTMKECEMSSRDYKAIVKLPGNDCCADCESTDTEWASVTFGILLCAHCSGVHRAMGTHISRVRSIKMDNWSKDHLNIMRSGGNRSCQRYLECHGVPLDEEIPIKYSCEAAQEYKEVLKGRVAKKFGKKLDETESSTEQGSSVASGGSGSKQKHSPMEPMCDESCASFANEGSVALGDERRVERRSSAGGDHTGLMNDSGGGWTEEESTAAPSTLDSWFAATKRKVPALRTSSTSMVGQSTHSTPLPRRNYRRSHSSNSTPTITYMGRSFSADGSDASKVIEQQGKARFRSQSDVKLLAELSLQQEEIARENLNASWRQSAPANFWTADKKVEPFQSADSVTHGGGGYVFSSSGQTERRGSGSRRARHQESMRQKLAYTDADLLRIAQDDQEFARLKAGLKHKGAVTNEVLKQKLYAFVAKSKLRRSGTTEPDQQPRKDEEHNNNNNNNKPKRRNLRSSKSDDMLHLKAKTIHTSTAQRW